MKTLYIAHHETTVWGWSFISECDAVNSAIAYLAEYPCENTELDGVIELNVPENATDDDFIDCSSIKEYRNKAERLCDDEM